MTPIHSMYLLCIYSDTMGIEAWYCCSFIHRFVFCFFVFFFFCCFFFFFFFCFVLFFCFFVFFFFFVVVVVVVVVFSKEMSYTIFSMTVRK